MNKIKICSICGKTISKKEDWFFSPSGYQCVGCLDKANKIEVK